MPITDLMPWRKDREQKSIQTGNVRDQMTELHREMNQLFEDFFSEPFGLSPFEEGKDLSSTFTPNLDISETDKEINVSLELPGMEADDIDISFQGNTLTISGEKQSESEEKGEHFFRKERTYGSFRRSIPLPSEVDEEEIAANFKRGVLKVNLPKSEKARKETRRIQIKQS